MVSGHPRQRSISSNEESDNLNNTQQDDSPTLPPTPGDNGTETLNHTPNTLSNSSNTSSALINPISPHNLTNSSTPATLRTEFNLQTTNSSYTVSSPHYFQVTSPTITPPLSSTSPGQSLNRLTSPNHRSSMQTSNPSTPTTSSTKRHNHHNQHHRGEGRRNNSAEPNLPLALHVDPAPAPAMYWSKTRTHGKPPKALRAHTVNLVGELMYCFGGCDAKTCFNSVLIFDADTMYWNRARTIGDPPPVCRAHSSTLVDKKLFIFGGGDGPVYFNNLYIFDTGK